ncbi:MAG: hypothetical protein ABI599_17230 [Flavobacteriales bacterium]
MNTPALILGVTLAAVWPLAGVGQNLVPNWSFEDYLQCPDNPAQIERALGWRQVQGTPEYFNVCSTEPWASVPANRVGYQLPHSGDAYGGLITYSDSDWFDPPELLREVIGIALLEPLVPGIPVTISFWVAPAAFGMAGTRIKWTTSGIGVKFTTMPLQLQVPEPAMNDAVVFFNNSLLDTAGWSLVSGSYIPDSAYNRLLIGNFISDSLLSVANIDALGTYGVAYIYVDDVCVSAIDGICATMQSTIEVKHGPAWVIGPNPVSGSTCLRFEAPITHDCELALRDATGRIVHFETVPRGSIRVDLHFERLNCGQYLLECRPARGDESPFRFTLVKP